MITQEQYDRTTFCKKWAKTPQEAKKKLRAKLIDAWMNYLNANDELDKDVSTDDIREAKNDFSIIGCEPPLSLLQVKTEEAWKTVYEKFGKQFLIESPSYEHFAELVQERYILNADQWRLILKEWEEKEEILLDTVQS